MQTRSAATKDVVENNRQKSLDQVLDQVYSFERFNVKMVVSAKYQGFSQAYAY